MMTGGKSTYLLGGALLLFVFAVLVPSSLGTQGASGSVGGVAIDDNGAGIANATVTLRCDCAECPNLPCNDCCPSGFSRTVTTDDDGRFRLDQVPAGVYVLSGEAQGFAVAKINGVKVKASATQSVVLRFGSGGDISVSEVVAGRQGSAPGASPAASAAKRSTDNKTAAPTLVRGKVVDNANDDRPVAGARVTLRRRCHCQIDCPHDPCETCCPSFPAVTDNEGAFNVSVPPGEYSGVAISGSYSKDFTLKVPEKRTKRFEIGLALGKEERKLNQ